MAQQAEIAGKIVLCNRGIHDRVAKAINVANGGGVGFILANASAEENLVDDAFVIPGLHISYAAGQSLRTWMTGRTVTATISGSSFESSAPKADLVAYFSSRGPARDGLNSILKPDIAAPGVSIFAALSDTGTANPDFGLLNGTSMASPHVAGSAALLRGLHPTWTAGQIQSALMTTSYNGTKKEDGTTASDPFDVGSGRVRVALAAQAGLVLDEHPNTFRNVDINDGRTIAALNIPSLASANCAMSCSWKRTFTNPLTTAVTWSFSGLSADLSASPASFSIAAGGSQEVTFTLNVAGKSLHSYVFERATLTASGNLAPDVILPVAVRVATSDMPQKRIISSNNPNTSQDLAISFVDYAAGSSTVKGLIKADTITTSIEDGKSYSNTISIPANTARFVVDLRKSPSLDLDLYIYNSNWDIVCQSASGAVLEYCSIDNPTAGNYYLYIDNFAASSLGASDQVIFKQAIVPNAPSGSLTVSFPSSHSGSGKQTVNESYNLSGSAVGDSWYGAYELTDTSTPRSLAKTLIDFHHVLGEPASIAVQAGNNQSATVNSGFATNLAVVVKDSQNNPIPGVTVTFTKPSSGASLLLASDSPVTDASGIASVAAVANTTAGSYSVMASVNNTLTTNFSLSNTAGAPAILDVVAGSGQATQVEAAFGQALQVKIADQYGNPLANQNISFSAPTSGASAVLGSPSATSNSSGIASVSTHANDKVGSYKVTAQAGALSAEFALSNTAKSSGGGDNGGGVKNFTVYLPIVKR